MKIDRDTTARPETGSRSQRYMNKSSYSVPIAISVAMHTALVVVLVWGWQHTPAPKKTITPRYVEATLVTINPQAKEPVVAAPKPKVEDVPAKPQPQQQQAEAEQKKRIAAEQAERERKVAEEKKKQEQEVAEKKKKEQELAEQKKKEQELAEKKKKEQELAEKKKKEQELAEQKKKEQELAEKKKKEQELAEKKRKEQAEAEKKRQEQERLKEQQRKQEAAFAEALAQEEAMLSAQQSEVTAQSYVGIMAQRIERNWSRPPSARKGMVCELRIQLVPTGQVINVMVTKSSGNAAFDRSAVAAVERVGRFEELQQVPSDVFEQHFRQVTIVFNPQDLRL